MSTSSFDGFAWLCASRHTFTAKTVHVGPRSAMSDIENIRICVVFACVAFRKGPTIFSAAFGDNYRMISMEIVNESEFKH